MEPHINITQSEPWEQKLRMAIKLYVDNGQPGKRLISDQAEQAITTEIEKFGSISVAQMKSPESILKAATDPAKQEEFQRFTNSFYELVFKSLPDSKNTNTTI